ncbi:GGDEF domain-containing protein [Psychromonas sp. KJ10-2]|uniref:GGDEF domain-containing protein n=1 Tax=Psychromonas sp. KJ10-2 TaxID=3391822 RepID=UPI0039B4F77C
MATNIDLKDIHWLIDMVHNIDVGLVIIEKDYTVKVWNGFMENHSGLLSAHMIDKKITDVFTSIPQTWLQQKINSVCLLKNKAFTTWEQRPYLFKFKSYRPITSNAEFMYQNVTFLPLADFQGQVTQICMIVYDVTDIALTKQAFQEANSQLKHLSHTDSLTQLNNQGHWRSLCANEFINSKNAASPTSTIIFDIDHFKKINDTYGHPFGDEVLKGIAEAVRQKSKKQDIIGRVGGEEFALLLLDTNLKQATLVAERLREAIEAIHFEYQGKQVKVTASFGVAQITESITNFESWIEVADLGLYIAKNNGRNQVGISEH